MNSLPLAGVYPILATTFCDEGRLDLSSQVSLVDYLLEQGAHGLGLFGNASEGYALLESEREELLRLIVRRVNGRVPLVVSTGHNGTYAAAELSRAAEAEGASALMVLPPHYLKTDAEGLIRYYSTVGSAVKIPIMVQDAPLATQVVMPPALLARMSQEIENLQYVKVEAPPTGEKILTILEFSAGKLKVFGGLNGQFLYEELERGALGVMPNSDSTSIYVHIWNSFRAGDKAEAWRVFAHALPLIRFELQPGLGVSAAKHNLVAAGVIRSSAVRHPTNSLAADSLKELAFLRRWVAEVLCNAT